MTHRLRFEDLGFLARAPVRQACTRDLHTPADLLFEQLAARPQDWPRWLGFARECQYQGAPPFGIGTKRQLRVAGGLRFQEAVIAWDPGERFAYRIEETNVPGITAMMEEWSLTPLSQTRTRVSWTMAADGSRPVRLMMRAGRRRVDKTFGKAMRRLDRMPRPPRL
ncbi:SRPBCC family protein [Streptomyces sp. NPDC029216]|uniref:SRPBCC family protein n=1 Tax=Streptomyces sp. NPDC029216 TaxID=3154701 RepID=UPI0033CB066D